MDIERAQVDMLCPSGEPLAMSNAIVRSMGSVCWLFASGIIARREHLHTPIGKQLESVLNEVTTLLRETEFDRDDIVRVRLYVTHLSDSTFAEIHRIRREWFTNYPASTLVCVSGLVVPGANLELDFDAVKDATTRGEGSQV